MKIDGYILLLGVLIFGLGAFALLAPKLLITLTFALIILGVFFLIALAIKVELKIRKLN